MHCFNNQSFITITNLHNFSFRTGGAAFFVPDNTGPDYINNALSGCLDFLPSIPSRQKETTLFQETYTNGKVVDESISIDQFSGRDVSIQIDHDLTGPFTVSTDFSNQTFNIKDAGTLVIPLPTVEIGDYRVKIESNGNGKINFLTLLISSKSTEGVDPMITNCWTNAGQEDVNMSGSDPDKLVIYGQAIQGSNPVLNADMRAYITANTEEELQLKDDGVTPDAIKNDGIYSSYYIPGDLQSGDTRYSLVCKVAGTNLTTVVNTTSTKQGDNWIKGRSLPSHPSSTTPLCCGSVATKACSIQYTHSF